MPEYKPTKSELSSFCMGMYDMYEFSRGVKPDAIIFPLRGAQPFSVAYQKIAELYQEATPNFLLLPLGTFTNVHTGKDRGLKGPEKIKIVNSSLDKYFASHQSARNILLIDEVMNGGTSLTHYHLINRYLRENISDAVLGACLIEHGKHNQRAKYRTQVKKHKFHTVRVDSLFIMDREQYLPKVSRNGDFSVEMEEGKLDDILGEIERIH